MNMPRTYRRTLLGRLVPMSAMAIAALFAMLVVRHSNDHSWMLMSPVKRVFVAGCLVAVAAMTELLVLRQVKFISRGEATSLVVDDIRPIRWSTDHLQVMYHFFTNDRRVISATAAISKDEQSDWAIGANVPAMYDPARPARHALSTRRLWAVDWEFNTESLDAAMDEASIAMIAIHPRRAA